jgi:hypothetical protein
MTKILVDSFGVDYQDYMVEHATEQADGEGYVKDGQELFMMINGIGKYMWCGNITLYPKTEKTFQSLIERTVMIYLLYACEATEHYNCWLRIGVDGVAIRINTTARSFNTDDLSGYSNSILDSYIEQIFAFGTGEFPTRRFISI